MGKPEMTGCDVGSLLQEGFISLVIRVARLRLFATLTMILAQAQQSAQTFKSGTTFRQRAAEKQLIFKASLSRRADGLAAFTIEETKFLAAHAGASWRRRATFSLLAPENSSRPYLDFHLQNVALVRGAVSANCESG
jgi:hypothetical protein